MALGTVGGVQREDLAFYQNKAFSEIEPDVPPRTSMLKTETGTAFSIQNGYLHDY